MQEHSLHQEGSNLGGSPKDGEGNPSGQTPMGTPVLHQQVEADYRDETIQSFAQNILRLGQECRTLADENKTLKSEVERLRKADGWQPMETAPFDPNIRIIICTFDDEVEITYSSDLCHYSKREYPRYWMPAPKPPKEGKPSV